MTALDRLAEIGTSTWLDDLSRERIVSGNLADMITNKSVVGVTTNPAIFAAAMTTGDAYDDAIKDLKEKGVSVDEAVYSMAIEDVRNACDLFRDVWEKTGGEDGRVSIEVDPRISDDAEATIKQARELWKAVDRPNVMIKIPATEGSLPAVEAALAEGICVNVTLIFSVENYRKVANAYINGIKAAAENGLDVSKIFSVASFFVSRLDAEVDKRLDAIGTKDALALRGKAGIANIRIGYAVFKEIFDFADLPEGANLQRPLWASTGVKNPDYPGDIYVVEIAGPNTVNTMPEPTIDAALAGSGPTGDTLTGRREEAEQVFEDLAKVGIDIDDVFAVLMQEGVDKFVGSWTGLLDALSPRLA